MESEVKLIRSDDISCIVGDEGYLGKGSNGIVRCGFHQIRGVVAIKCTEMQGSAKRKNVLEKKIKREIAIVQSANHDNIVRVYGWSWWPGAIAIVMEYLPGGNLMELIEDDDIDLDPLMCLRMCYEISNGIAFIHNFSSDKRLIHGDIKAENILLTQDVHCKISDFGGAQLSNITGQTTVTKSKKLSSKPNQYTEIYASPEVLKNPTMTLEASHDTFSFAIISYIVLGRKVPVTAEHLKIYLNRVMIGERPSLAAIENLMNKHETQGMTENVKVIEIIRQEIIKCWNPNPNARPKMLKVKENLLDCLKNHDPVKIQRQAVEIASKMSIQTFTHNRYECASLNSFVSPHFRHCKDISPSSIVSSADYFSTSSHTVRSSVSGSVNTVGAILLQYAKETPTITPTTVLGNSTSQPSCSYDVETAASSNNDAVIENFNSRSPFNAPQSEASEKSLEIAPKGIKQQIFEKTRLIVSYFEINQAKETIAQSKELCVISVEDVSNADVEYVAEEVMKSALCVCKNTACCAAAVLLLKWVVKLCCSLVDEEVKLKKLDKCGWAVSLIAYSLNDDNKADEIKNSCLPLLQELGEKLRLLKHGGVELSARMDAWSMCRLGYCYNFIGEYTQTVKLSEEAAKLLKSVYGRYAAKCVALAVCYRVSARAHELLGKHAAAIEEYKLCIETYKSAKDVENEIRNQELEAVQKSLEALQLK